MYKRIHGVSGERRLFDNVGQKTATTHYPFTSTTGGRCKTLTAASTLTQADNGSVFFLNAATEFATTLPAPFCGAEFTFIVKAAPVGANYTVVTASSANIIVGMQNSVAGDAGDTGTADDTISFVGGSSLAGDRVELISDGTSWFAYATSKVAAAITFTQAST